MGLQGSLFGGAGADERRLPAAGLRAGGGALYSSQVLDGAASALLAVSAYAMLADRSGENMAIDRGRQSAASNRGALYGVFLYFMLLTWLGFGQGWKAFSCCAQC